MGNNTPTLASLEKPVKGDELLKQERRDYDCTPCRLVGGTAFIGLGAYTHWEGMNQLRKNEAAILKRKSLIGMRGRKAGLAATSFALCWMGLYRLFG